MNRVAGFSAPLLPSFGNGNKSLKISDEMTLPIKIAQEVTLLLGTRGMGKSYSAGVLIEEFQKNGVQFCCWDLLGAHRKIRLPGVEVVTLRKGQTLNIDKLVSRLIASKKSLIIDMSEIMGEPASTGRGSKQAELVGQYATKLLEANPAARGKVILTIIEEAEEFAPMGNAKWVQESIVPLNRLTKQGRARGCGVLFITQRPQDFSARLRSQASNFIVHRLTNYTELDVMQKQLVAASRGDTKPIIHRIFTFDVGEAMMLSPHVPDGIAFTRIRKRETEHGGVNVLGESPPIGGGLGFPGEITNEPPEPNLAYGSEDDLKELIVPAFPGDAPYSKLDAIVSVGLLAVGGLTAYLIYDHYQKERARSFDQSEEAYSAVRYAVMGGDEEEGGGPEEESSSDIDFDEIIRDGDKSKLPPTAQNVFDLDDYDPFSPNEVRTVYRK